MTACVPFARERASLIFSDTSRPTDRSKNSHPSNNNQNLFNNSYDQEVTNQRYPAEKENSASLDLFAHVAWKASLLSLDPV